MYFCTKAYCPLLPIGCNTCPFRQYRPDEKRKTNADRIRAMSDEELLELLSAPCPLLRRATDKGCAIPKPCRECIAEWLKQPAEEDDDDG